MACPFQRGLAPNHVLKESDIHDSGITGNIGLKWKDLGRAIGFNEAKIEAVEKEKGFSCNECCIQLLVLWLHLKGEEAIAGKLAEALTRIGMKNLADNLIKGHKRCQCTCSLKGSLAESSHPDQDDNGKKLIGEMSAKLVSLEGEMSKKDTRIKDLEDELSSLTKENSSLRAKLKELKGEKRQQDSDNTESPDIGEASGLSNDMDVAARETNMNEELKNLKEKLSERVTKLLEVPVVNQDQLKTPVKLNLLLRLTKSLQMIYTKTMTMVTETCKCSEDLRREFYDFAYHGLRAEHNELTHRVEDLESALPEMSEEEKKDFEQLKRYQDNQQRQVERLDRLWKGLFSPPERLAEASRSLPNGAHHTGDKLTNNKKVSRHTDPGAKPKQIKPRDRASSSGMPSINDDDKYEVQLNITTHKSKKGLFKKKEDENTCILLSCSSRRDS